MYFTDRGIEELAQRRGEEEVSLAWLCDRLVEFVDTHPEHEVPVERLATWLARLDDARTTEARQRRGFRVTSGTVASSGRSRQCSTVAATVAALVHSAGS